MLDSHLMKEITRSGFAPANSLIHLFVGGSELHGAKVGTTDDLDIYGVFLETPEEALGLKPRHHFVWSTADDDRRNGPDDVDVTLYSLRRWAALASNGNATSLHFLFADATSVSDDLWRMVQMNRMLFLSKRSSAQFLGFADNQLGRLTGAKGSGKKGQRPEYIGKFGYDTKAAMHCLRLYFECIELMREHRITLPRPEHDVLIEVRTGAWTLERFLHEAAELRTVAEDAALQSSLPDYVDKDRISSLIANVHLRAWGQSSVAAAS
jgi:predicted nucleotidyltransferase